MEKQSKKTCFKCKESAAFKFRKNLSICSSCFDFYVLRKKFRQNLRNQVDVIGKENQVVAFLDGTLPSVVLLKLLAENLEGNALELHNTKSR